MRFRILSLLVALAAAVVVVGSSGAVTAKQRGVAKIDVSTTAGVIHYLRSIHVNPKGVVIQRGLRNYAGARCPGKRWTCASTKHTVVQIAKRGGQNRFTCGAAKCVVVQFGSLSRGRHPAAYASSSTLPMPVNTASCIKISGVTQSCVINQPNATGTNKAVVWMDTGKLTGLTQSANYTASITQGPPSGNSSNWNLACVHQFVRIDGSATKTNAAAVTVTNDAHESVSIKQNSRTGNNTVQAAASAGSGKNITYDCKTDGSGNPDSTSAATQEQVLSSIVTTKGPITQNQDAAYSPCGDGVAGDYANLCLDVEQNQGADFKCTTDPVLSCPSSGFNTATFTQTSTQTAIANTTAGPVSQTQSTPLCSDPSAPANCVFPGGLVGTLNQDSSHKSTAKPTQVETQCQDAATPSSPGYPLATCKKDDPVPTGLTLTQNQYGPVGVVGTLRPKRGPYARGKGLGQSFQIGNTGNEYTISQTSTQDNNEGTGSNQQNFGRVDCTTTGSCTAGQTTTLNGAGTGDGYTSPTISNLVINCPTGASCAATPPPVPTITASSEPSNPTESRDATFEWTDAATNGVTFKCSIDNSAFTACTSGGTGATFSNLGTGSHTFEVEAVDTSISHNESAPASFTWTIVDGNISLSPLTATNQAGTSHTVTCTINQDTGDGNGFVPAPNGTECDWSISTGPNSSQSGSCNTSGGTCQFNYTDTGGTGTDTIHATTTFTVNTVSLTRSTLASGTDIHGDGTDVAKTWVDAHILLSPLTAANPAGGSQTMTCTIEQKTGAAFGAAPDGTGCAWSITGGPHSGAQSGSCSTTGGTCQFIVSDADLATGTDTIHATTTFLVAGLSLTRSTLASGTDSSGDSTDASIEWDAAP